MAVRTHNYQNIEPVVQFCGEEKKKKEKKKNEYTPISLPYPPVSPSCPKYATEEANWTCAIWQHLYSLPEAL